MNVLAVTSDGKFVASGSAEAYDVRARAPNREFRTNFEDERFQRCTAFLAGTTLRIPGEEKAKRMQFVSIPAGSFMMGCSAGDAECHAEEKPAHRVSITRPFEMGKFQVTQTQYETVTTVNPSYSRGPNLPVEGVSWHDAQKFCEALNDKGDGYHYRLPTEAEWEYAARAGDSSCRYGPLVEVAWFHDNSGGRTHPVGEKKPNGFGLFDTLGNVWEWVQDWYDITYYSHSPESDPKGPGRGEYRVSRGGSWRGVVRGLARVSSRYTLKPNVRSIVVGFRCAREPVR